MSTKSLVVGEHEISREQLRLKGHAINSSQWEYVTLRAQSVERGPFMPTVKGSKLLCGAAEYFHSLF